MPQLKSKQPSRIAFNQAWNLQKKLDERFEAKYFVALLIPVPSIFLGQQERCPWSRKERKGLLRHTCLLRKRQKGPPHHLRTRKACLFSELLKLTVAIEVQ